MNQPRVLLWLAVSSEEQAKDEKTSLETQEQDLRAVGAKLNWNIIDVLMIPGFSRVYYNFPEFANAAADAGFDAGLRLMEHWRRRDFDVLAYREGSRIGREQSILAEAVTRTIDTGAQIYDLLYGWVDRNNYRMYISMVAFGASTDIDKLTKYYDAGMTARAQRGLAVTSNVAISHKIIRDDRGRAVKQVVDESKRRLLNDVATLVIQGVAWEKIEIELVQQFGHLDQDGHPYSRYFFYNLLHRPSFWGHSARYQSKTPYRHSQEWAYDTSQSPPAGILLFRDTHEPAYTGDLAVQVQAELKRRKIVGKGKGHPIKSHTFSGLVACGTCGYTMRYVNGKGAAGYYCDRHRPYKDRPACPARTYISEKRLKAWLSPQLQVIIDGYGDSLRPEPSNAELLAARLADVNRDIVQVEARARLLIQKQLAAPESLSGLYDQELQGLGEQLTILHDVAASTQRDLEGIEQNSSKQAAQQLREVETLDAFWHLEEKTINQLLHALLNGRQIYIATGASEWVIAPRRKHPSWH